MIIDIQRNETEVIRFYAINYGKQLNYVDYLHLKIYIGVTCNFLLKFFIAQKTADRHNIQQIPV